MAYATLNATVDFSDKREVFLDHACAGNGTKNAVGAYRVHYPGGDPRSVCRKLLPAEPAWTNNRVSLKSLITALKGETKGGRLLVKTTNEYTVCLLARLIVCLLD